MDLKSKVDLLRSKLSNPQQVMLKSALTKLGKIDELPTWQAIRTSLIKLVGGNADAASLVAKMRRTHEVTQRASEIGPQGPSMSSPMHLEGNPKAT